MILRRSQSVHFFIYISSSALPLTTLPTSVYSLQILLLLSLINPVNSENVSIIIIHNCGLNKCILEYSSFLPPSNMIFSRNIIFISLIITFASGGKTISGARFQNNISNIIEGDSALEEDILKFEKSNFLDRVSLEEYPLAVCNDGTSAVYYRHLENTDQNRKMLIFLKGGGFCVPFVPGFDCTSRCKNNPDLCSARTDPNFDIENYGHFGSSDPVINPAFHDFDKGANQNPALSFLIISENLSICSLL